MGKKRSDELRALCERIAGPRPNDSGVRCGKEGHRPINISLCMNENNGGRWYTKCMNKNCRWWHFFSPPATPEDRNSIQAQIQRDKAQIQRDKAQIQRDKAQIQRDKEHGQANKKKPRKPSNAGSSSPGPALPSSPLGRKTETRSNRTRLRVQSLSQSLKRKRTMSSLPEAEPRASTSKSTPVDKCRKRQKKGTVHNPIIIDDDSDGDVVVITDSDDV